MIFEGDHIYLASLLKIELPDHTVRLTDGGAVYFEGELYESEDSIFGSIAEAQSYSQGEGDQAPGGMISFYPADAAGVNQLVSPAMQGSRIRTWNAQVLPETGVVIGAELLGDGRIDVPILKLSRSKRLVEMSVISSSERLFLVNKGNSLSQGFHQSIWPGELGLNYCTGVEIDVPWGTSSRPRGAVGGGSSSTGGGYGGNSDGRNASYY